MNRKMKWLDKFNERVSHLDVAVFNCLAGILLCVTMIFGNRYWWVYLFLFLNIISMVANLFMSWKKDEFNRRKYRKNPGELV